MSVEVLKLTQTMIVIIATVLNMGGIAVFCCLRADLEDILGYIVLGVMTAVGVLSAVLYWILQYRIIATGIV